MEAPERVNIASLFVVESARMPRNIAAELEDHLTEEMDRHLANGKSVEEARLEALKSFGDLAVIAADLQRIQRDPWWSQVRTPWQLRALILGWVGFGLACLYQICLEENPSYLTISASLLVGLCGSLVGLGLLRRREALRRLALMFSVAVGIALVAKSALVQGLPALLPLSPWTVPVVAGAALLSAWLLNRPVIRNCFV